MINFKDFLGNLTSNCDRIFGAVVMDFSGVTLSKFFTNELPLSPDVYEAFISEFSPLINKFCSKAKIMDVGTMKNINVEMGEYVILFKILSKNNFLAVIAESGAYLGQIDYYASIEAKRFTEAFGG